MICTFNDDNVCKRHGRKHYGHTKVIATDPSDYAESIRILWDKSGSNKKTINKEPARKTSRSISDAAKCKHLGSSLADEHISERRAKLRLAGVGCAACPSHLCSHPTAGPETKLAAKCLWCKEYQERDGVDPLEAAASVPWA